MSGEEASVEVGREGEGRRRRRTGSSVHGAAGDEASFDELVGVSAEDLSVLAVRGWKSWCGERVSWRDLGGEERRARGRKEGEVRRTKFRVLLHRR